MPNIILTIIVSFLLFSYSYEISRAVDKKLLFNIKNTFRLLFAPVVHLGFCVYSIFSVAYVLGCLLYLSGNIFYFGLLELFRK